MCVTHRAAKQKTRKLLIIVPDAGTCNAMIAGSCLVHFYTVEFIKNETN